MRSTRASRGHGTSFATTQLAVCAVAKKVTEERTAVLQRYFYTREERLDRATGADPRTEQTTREPDWGKPGELQRAQR